MQSVFDSLGIELNQVVTNIIGFAIFLWLMAKFAWVPILAHIDQRSKDISDTFAKIEREKSDIVREQEKYEKLIADIDSEATTRIQEAIKRGQAAASQIESEARAKAGAILEKAKADTDRKLEEARLSLKEQVIEVGVEAGRKAAMGVLDETAHRKLVERFVEELTHVR